MNGKRDSMPRDTNPDPITGAPGAHPAGVGLGGAGGGAAGAAIGAAVGGPVGAVAGAVVGTIAGGLAGKGVAEVVNPTAEHTFWRNEYKNRPYYDASTPYDEYGPAYQYGWESYAADRSRNRSFDEVEADLQRDWERRRATSTLDWEDARDATRDAWDRMAHRNNPIDRI